MTNGFEAVIPIVHTKTNHQFILYNHNNLLFPPIVIIYV